MENTVNPTNTATLAETLLTPTVVAEPKKPRSPQKPRVKNGMAVNWPDGDFVLNDVKTECCEATRLIRLKQAIRDGVVRVKSERETGKRGRKAFIYVRC